MRAQAGDDAIQLLAKVLKALARDSPGRVGELQRHAAGFPRAQHGGDERASQLSLVGLEHLRCWRGVPVERPAHPDLLTGRCPVSTVWVAHAVECLEING